jgi:hypothetical protein
MKTLIILLMLALIILTGLVSYNLFEGAAYLTSALLIVTSYASASLAVYLASQKKVVLQ